MLFVIIDQQTLINIYQSNLLCEKGAYPAADPITFCLLVQSQCCSSLSFDAAVSRRINLPTNSEGAQENPINPELAFCRRVLLVKETGVVKREDSGELEEELGRTQRGKDSELGRDDFENGAYLVGSVMC